MAAASGRAPPFRLQQEHLPGTLRLFHPLQQSRIRHLPWSAAMSQTLDLGQLCLSVSKANLQLTSQATITASLQNTALTDVATLSSVLAERSGWVRRGQGLHLALDICVNGKPLDCQQSHHVANSICNAELWKQLQFRPTLPVSPLDNREELSSIGINLAHSNVECESQERHRLATGASIADVQPPDGVHVVLLEQVILKVEISPIRQRKVQRKKHHGARRLENSQTQVSETPESEIDLISMDDVGEEEDFEIVSDDSMLLDSPEDYPMTYSSETVGSHRRRSTSKTTRVDSGISMEVEDEGLREKDGALSSETIASLVDTVLYYSICEKAPKQKGGVKVKSDDMKMKLASIAPALWSPDFLKTISERAPFISTIAHTLSSPLLMQAKSPGLREKLSELQQLHHPIPHSSLSTSDPMPSSQGTLFQSVSVNLWKLLQRELYDPGAARRIRPLKTENDHSLGMSNDDDLLPEFSNDSIFDSSGVQGFERLDDAEYEYDAFLGVDDDEDDEFGLLHDPDFSDEMIVDSVYNMPLQDNFTSVEHKDDFLSGMLHDSSDFDDIFESGELDDLL
ncbi:hypothetical protein IWX90DRAFT_7211 [Phyllosticta citrichinensis]|uniref:Uncharacterized protein n=1 Tax=Phyllosticta citrichinensis TaxID=1130410 RepID=A0ABR1Y5N0_9PEZI